MTGTKLGSSPGLFEHPTMFSARCMKSACTNEVRPETAASLRLVGLSQQFRHECRIIAVTVTRNCRNPDTNSCKSFRSNGRNFT